MQIGGDDYMEPDMCSGFHLGLNDTFLMSTVLWGTDHMALGKYFSFSVLLWYVENQISMGGGNTPKSFQIDSCNFLSYDSYHYISLFYSFKKISSSVIM